VLEVLVVRAVQPVQRVLLAVLAFRNLAEVEEVLLSPWVVLAEVFYFKVFWYNQAELAAATQSAQLAHR
jgi:hypothetical protein